MHLIKLPPKNNRIYFSSLIPDKDLQITFNANELTKSVRIRFYNYETLWRAIKGLGQVKDITVKIRYHGFLPLLYHRY